MPPYALTSDQPKKAALALNCGSATFAGGIGGSGCRA
jgi:hypothetical protein